MKGMLPSLECFYFIIAAFILHPCFYVDAQPTRVLNSGQLIFATGAQACGRTCLALKTLRPTRTAT
jgi:hypothetical protein